MKNNSHPQKRVYILNIAVNEYDLNELNQIGDMYGSFLGDLNAVNSHVYRLQSDIDVASKVDFILIPLYLHYFSNRNNFSNGYGNKALILNRLAKIEKEFKKKENRDVEKIFVFFLHGHGDIGECENAGSYIFVDNYNEGNDEKDQISKQEIFKAIAPILKMANCYFVMNSCKSATSKNPRSNSNIQEKSFKDNEALKDLDSYNTFYSLGMSSDAVYKDKHDKMTYGIKILKGVMEIGLKQDVCQVFESTTTILNQLNKNVTNKFYLPVLEIFTKAGKKFSMHPKITSDNYLIWNFKKSSNPLDENKDKS